MFVLLSVTCSLAQINDSRTWHLYWQSVIIQTHSAHAPLQNHKPSGTESDSAVILHATGKFLIYTTTDPAAGLHYEESGDFVGSC